MPKDLISYIYIYEKEDLRKWKLIRYYYFINILYIYIYTYIYIYIMYIYIDIYIIEVTLSYL